MIGQIKGFLMLAAMLGLMLVAFRLVVTLDSIALVATIAFLVTIFLISIFWKLAIKSDVEMNYWIVGVAIFGFTILRLSYPIEYDRTLGWTFVVGMGVALLFSATFFILKSSYRDERTR